MKEYLGEGEGGGCGPGAKRVKVPQSNSQGSTCTASTSRGSLRAMFRHGTPRHVPVGRVRQPIGGPGRRWAPAGAWNECEGWGAIQTTATVETMPEAYPYPPHTPCGGLPLSRRPPATSRPSPRRRRQKPLHGSVRRGPRTQGTRVARGAQGLLLPVGAIAPLLLLTSRGLGTRAVSSTG